MFKSIYSVICHEIHIVFKVFILNKSDLGIDPGLGVLQIFPLINHTNFIFLTKLNAKFVIFYNYISFIICSIKKENS